MLEPQDVDEEELKRRALEAIEFEFLQFKKAVNIEAIQVFKLTNARTHQELHGGNHVFKAAQERRVAQEATQKCVKTLIEMYIGYFNEFEER